MNRVTPTISVVIPAYNTSNTIRRSIASVVNQTLPAAEIIIVDDGSTDDTRAIVTSYSDTRIKYFFQENRGVSAARNSAIKHANGDWIAFLDADDEWLPEKLLEFTLLLKKFPNIEWSFTNYDRTAESPTRNSESDSTFQIQNFFCLNNTEVGLWTGTLIIKRDTLLDIGLFNEVLKQGEDTDLWFRIGLKQPEIGYISKKLTRYNSTANSLSKCREQISSMIDRYYKLESLCQKNEHRICLYRIIINKVHSLINNGRNTEALQLSLSWRLNIPLKKKLELLLYILGGSPIRYVIKRYHYIKERVALQKNRATLKH